MPEIRYQFVATDAGSVITAFKNISSAAKESAAAVKRANKESTTQSGSVDKAAEKAAAAQERAAKKVEAAQARLAQKAAKAQEKAAQQAAKAQERAAQQATKAQEAATKQQARIRERDLRQSTAAMERANRIKERAFERLERMREKALEKATRKREKEAEKAAKAELREEQKAARKREALIAKERRDRQRANSDFARGIGRRFTTAAKGLVVGGAAMAGLAVRDNMRLNETSTRLAIAARDSGGKMLDPRALSKEFQDVATTTPGVTAQGVADAAARFAALTGDLDTARKSLKTFATIATATGSDIGEISEAAASLSNQLGIKSDDQFKDVFATLIAQGKGGAFELADMAAQFQRLAASGGAFGIEQSVQGVKTLGGLTQIARSGTGSPEQAATAVEHLMTGLTTKSQELKKSGVSVYNKDGSTRGLVDVITDVVSKVGGTDMEKKSAELSSLFGAYGGRALNPLITEFKGTYQSTSGSKEDKLAAATEAVRKKFDEAANAAGTWSDVTYEASVAQSMSSARLSQSWESFSSRVGDKLTPVVADLLDKFADLATNTSLVDSFIFTLEAFAHAMQGTVDFLIGLGLIKKKELTPEERLNQSSDALAAFNSEHMGPLTESDMAKRNKLQADVDSAMGQSKITGSELMRTRTPEQFAEEYNKLGGDKNNKRGLNVATSLREGSWAANNDFLFGLGDENERQKRLRHDYASQLQYESMNPNAPTPGGAKVGPNASDGSAEVDAKMKALGAAADSATKSLNKVAMASQGSIVPIP